MVRGAMFSDLMFGYRLAEVPGETLRFAALVWRAFLGAGPGLAALGLIEQWRRDRTAAGALALMGGATVVFYVNYRVPDKNTMFLVPLLRPGTRPWMRSSSSSSGSCSPGGRCTRSRTTGSSGRASRWSGRAMCSGSASRGPATETGPRRLLAFGAGLPA